MQATQKEILSTMKVVRNEIRDLKREWEKRKEEAPEIVSVPNRIRNNVKEFYACGEDRELAWDLKKRFNDEANAEMTDFIKKSVKGVAPDVSFEVLDAAVKRYFTSKKEGATRKTKNKDLLHKQRQATYERKKGESTTKTGGYRQKEELDRGEEGISEKVSEYQTCIQIYV